MSDTMNQEPLRVALVDGEMYSPLYRRLETFTRETGRPVEVGARLQLPELLAHLRLGSAAGTGEETYHLVCAHSAYTASLAPGLRPLDDLLEPEELRDFAAPALELCRWEGRLQQLPRSVETRLLFYRSDLLEDRRQREWFAEASGGRELRVPETWEELAAVAQHFTRPGSMHGFAYPGRHMGLVATFAEILTSMGGVFFDDDGSPRFNSRAGEWTLTLLRDLYRRWEAVPRETPELHYEEISLLFRMGRCAMACDFPGTARLLRDPTFSAVAGWHSVALSPAGPDGRRAVWTGCPTFAIPAACPDVAGAATLLRHLTSPESQHLEARDGAIPSRVSVFREVREGLREGTVAHRRCGLVEETLRGALLSAPKLPHYAEAEFRLWPLLQQAITGDREVAEALELGARAVEKAGEAAGAPASG